MRVIFLFSLLFFGCGNEQQHVQCESLCQRLDTTCNDFEYEYCYEYCIGLDTLQQVNSFQSCGECYMAIECSDQLYGSICYPACEQ